MIQDQRLDAGEYIVFQCAHEARRQRSDRRARRGDDGARPRDRFDQPGGSRRSAPRHGHGDGRADSRSLSFGRTPDPQGEIERGADPAGPAEVTPAGTDDAGRNLRDRGFQGGCARHDGASSAQLPAALNSGGATMPP